MKSFLASEIEKIVNGTLITGSGQTIVTNATRYPERLKQPNTLIFLRNIRHVDWSHIKGHTPCVIITSTVVEELKSLDYCAVILVDHINHAYWRFIQYYRSLFEIPILAITGTSGKTTTKDMIKHILSHEYKITGTLHSANGRTGHLMNLTSIDDSIEAAVFETAVGKPNDITYACGHFKPTMGIITNIGIAHLDGCITPEAYREAKAEMIDAVGDEGILLINSDDENSSKIGIEKFKGRVVYFGIHHRAHFQASDIQYGINGMDFTLTHHHIRHKAFVSGYGEHQVYNAMAAIAAVHELGIGIKEAIELLHGFKNLPYHLELRKGINECQILDDTWNLTPLSLEAAFKTLNGIANGKMRVAIVGEIQRTGEFTEKITQQIGKMIAIQGIDLLITVGSTSYSIIKEALQAGLKAEVHSVVNTDGILDIIKPYLHKDTILLIKNHMYDDTLKDLIHYLKNNEDVSTQK